MKRVALLIAAGTLILADAVLLMGVAANRAGTPESKLTLSERELPLPPRTEENSALTLRLRWVSPQARVPERTEWLDASKLAGLGLSPRPGESVVVEAFGVLELDPEGVVPGESRLKAVDAGRSVETLRSRYPDRSKHAIIPAVVRAFFDESTHQPRGWFRPALEEIYVPPEHLARFRGLPPSAFPVLNPRYEVEVCFGSRAEPWVCGVR